MSKFAPFQTVRDIQARLQPTNRTYRALDSQARTTGTWILGQPGTGKSRFMTGQVIQDIMRGRGVCLVDIHGDLFRDVLYYVAGMCLKHPELARRVVILDPTKPQCTMSLNPLAPIPGQSQERIALFMVDVVIRIWQIDPNSSPRLVWLMTNTFLALANLGLSMAEFARWLQDRDFRSQHVENISHEAVQRYWLYEFPKGDKEAQVWIGPATNKLGGVLFDPQIQHVLTGNSKVSIRKILDEGLILLVHLPKGIIGEKSANLLGAFVVAMMQKSALSRADIEIRNQYYAHFDEGQNYCTSYIEDALTEARKYALTITFANQHTGQLPEAILSALINTSGTLVSFRIGHKDSRILAPEIFPYPDFPTGDPRFTGGWDKLALALSNLENRHNWVRRRPYHPVNLNTLSIRDPFVTPLIERAVDRLLELSGSLYGRGHTDSVVVSKPLPIPAAGVADLSFSEPEVLPLPPQPLPRYAEVIWDE